MTRKEKLLLLMWMVMLLWIWAHPKIERFM